MFQNVNKKLLRGLSLAIVLAMLFASLALADNTVPDGDGMEPVAANPMNFGTVCAGSTTTQTALIRVNRNGAAGSTNVFKDGSTVTVSVLSVSGTGLSAEMGSPNTITLPSNWGSLGNNSDSDYVSSDVTLVAGAASSFTGSVSYRGSGVNSSDSAINRDSAMNVTATIEDCTPIDTTPPVVTVPADMTVEATSAAGAVATFSASASDLVDGALTPICAPASGSTFALGTTTVTCTATDAAGNTGSASFDVTVEDTTPPVVTPPANVTAEATGPSGANVTYSGESATDLVDGAITPTCIPASGSTFALGTSTVNCSATDAAGNEGSASFSITVVDTTPPAVTVPADMTEEATGPSGAAVTFSASASDLVDGALTPTCSPPSGSTFPLGMTTVSCTATDDAGNTGSASFDVTIVDTTPPTLNLPGNINQEGNTTGGANTSYIVSATDIVDPNPTVSCNPPSGSFFGLGTTAVDCSATDASGNSSNGSFNVTVVDTTAPTLSLPADQTFEGNTTGGYNGPYVGATASDIVDSSPTVNCTPASGLLFPLGTTTVNCTATDGSGNSSNGSFSVTVVDTMAPSIACPPDFGGIVGQPVSLGSPEVSDIVDSSPTVGNDAPSSFPPGMTTVTWTATDDSDNSATCNQKVTLTYPFDGFYSPIDNNLANSAKAGQAIPIKWRLTDYYGNPVSNPASFISVASSANAAACGGTADAIETYTGSSGLQYLGDGYWQFNWKTPKSYAGQCRMMSLNLSDGTSHTANFTFK